MNFYTKVLSKFAAGKGLKLTVSRSVTADGGISPQKIEEIKVALRRTGAGGPDRPGIVTGKTGFWAPRDNALTCLRGGYEKRWKRPTKVENPEDQG